jgi:hypothetical protein
MGEALKLSTRYYSIFNCHSRHCPSINAATNCFSILTTLPARGGWQTSLAENGCSLPVRKELSKEVASKRLYVIVIEEPVFNVHNCQINRLGNSYPGQKGASLS